MEQGLGGSSQCWAAAIQHALEQDTEETRKALVNDYINHWSASGGEVAEDPARNLLIRHDVAISRLGQYNTPSPSTHTTTLSGTKPTAGTSVRCTHFSEEGLLGKREAHYGESNRSLLGPPALNLQESEEGPINPPKVVRRRVSHEQAMRSPKFDLSVFTDDIAKFPEFNIKTWRINQIFNLWVLFWSIRFIGQVVGCSRKLVETVVNESSGQGRRLLMDNLCWSMSSSIVGRWKFGYGSMQKPRSRQRHRVPCQCQSQHHVSQCKQSSGQQLIVKER
ncbi:unnamed protein product [Haemonchus placei]|uniref:Uncharacterized protein n=1 Tax=Haemonchus placei TaxID=6290 RepID=A0A0N4X8A5_HAEPC|nr:unnamed protein product [Haemonchus placei]